MFRHLHIYTVHILPSRARAFEAPVFLREGFNVWAFLLTLGWTLYHRLWLASAGLLAFYVGVALLQRAGVIAEPVSSVVMFAAQVIVGFHANDWRRAKMARGGYVVADIATGDSLLTAQQRFFDRNPVAA